MYDTDTGTQSEAKLKQADSTICRTDTPWTVKIGTERGKKSLLTEATFGFVEV